MKENQQVVQALPCPALLLIPEADSFRIEGASPAYLALTGKKSEELVAGVFPGEDFSDISRKRISRSLLHSRKTKTVDRIRFSRSNSPKGAFPPHFPDSFEIEHIPMLDPEGRVQSILHMIVQPKEDLSVVPLEKDLFTEGQQEHFINQNPDGLYTLDRAGRFTNMNEGLARLAELPEEQMLHMSFEPFCAPHSRQRVLELFQKALQGENQHFEADFISAKGREMVLDISLFPMRLEGEIQGIYGMAKDVTVLRQTQEELLKSQRKFQALVQEGSDLTAIVDLEGNYKFVSDTSKKVLGVVSRSFQGKNAFEFIHPEDKERVLQEFLVLEHDEQAEISPYRFRDGNGNWRWLESKATDLTQDPYVEGIVVNSKEVTELVERTTELEQLYERYRMAAGVTEDLVYDWNLETDEVVRFHQDEKKRFGYRPDQIDQRSFWRSHVHPEEVSFLREYLTQTLADPTQNQLRTQYRLRRADGSYAHLIDRARILRDRTGKAVRVIGATSDISEIISQENALKEAHQRYKLAMMATSEMIWDWDIERDHIVRSTNFEKMFGHQIPEDISIQDTWFDKVHSRDRERLRSSLHAALENPEAEKWSQEYRVIDKNQKVIFVVDRGHIVRNEDGKAIRMVGAMLDVTESRELLREIEKQNRVLREVAWEQAHVVRAPLARLKGLLNLLEIDSYQEWSRDEILRLISDSAEEIDDIIIKIIRKTEKVGSQ